MPETRAKRVFRALAAAGLVAAMAVAACVALAPALVPAPAVAAEKTMAKAPARHTNSTADHSKFEALNKEFETGSDVTKACLGCHVNAAKQVHKTKHWNWEFANPNTGQKLGKKNVINNYYVSLASNLSGCTSCHISTNWEDEDFDFKSETAVDCLACHDSTGEYFEEKFHNGPGDCLVCHDEKPETSGRESFTLAAMAKRVARPRRSDCGMCHFRGGGGDAVKHGDMDSSLANPGRSLDVHMNAKGRNFTCVTCHAADQHEVTGSRYVPRASDPKGIDVAGGSRATCASCHGETPHPGDSKINLHTRKVACQTCHIPRFARGGRATKMWWDWSKAGRLDDSGKPFVEKDAKGRVVYTTQKGEFAWAENVVPDYVWFNGDVEYTLLGDKIDPSKPISINRFIGNPDDPASRIWPVKVFRGKQPYDKVNKTLVVLHLAGRDRNAFWRSFDWNKSVSSAMKTVGAPFSGELGFVETRMLWPITHMVAPAKDALTCVDCHAEDGRLAKVPGLYLARRNSSAIVDGIGWLLVLATLGGVAVHGAIRFVGAMRKGDAP